MTQRGDGPTDARETSRRSVLKAVGTVGSAGLLGLAGCASRGASTGPGTGTDSGEGADAGSDLADSVLVFHAGSLAPPFSAAEPQFEEEYGVDVTREPKGSVASTQKITRQGRWADVLGVSDFRLIRDRVLPEFGNWYAIFTTNSMAIQYREDSPGADRISTENWWDVLTRDDVTIGHAAPAVDPGGYRAVMAQQLGTYEFRGSRLYDDATYRKLRENSVVPTGTETKLEGQLKSGALDYAIYYHSLASTSDLPYVDLQPHVDLSKATSEYARHYAKATVETESGTFTGAPIAYGMTVPDVAKHPGRGAQWVRYFATEPGRQILRDEGLAPVDPIVVPESGRDAVPDGVMDVAEAKSTLGPLQL